MGAGYLLVGYLYGIPSERQIEERISDSIALRWYLGIDLDERVPDHSSISQLRRRKPSFRKVFQRLFETVVRQCIELGLASGRMTATDSTHVRANASRKSEHLVDMPEEPGVHWDRLDAYEEEGLKKLEKKIGKRRTKRTRTDGVQHPGAASPARRQGADLRRHERGHLGRCRSRRQQEAAGQHDQSPAQAGHPAR